MTDLAPRKIRVVLCRGQYCNMSRLSDALLKRLEPLIDSVNGDLYPRPVKLEIANCLSLCGAGPNLVIYPANIVFNHVEPDMLLDIVEQHVRRSPESPSD
jgi:NADP-reducing hydrogenase subunit HndC